MNRIIGRGRGLDLVDDRFEPIFEFPLHSGAGLQQSQVERADRDVLQRRAARHPTATRSANPSTTAVLPTPASPVRIGLFCRRRVRISMICRISASRPQHGIDFTIARSLRQVNRELIERDGLAGPPNQSWCLTRAAETRAHPRKNRPPDRENLF